MGYSGMPLPAFAASITGLLVVLCLPVLLIGATGFLLPVVGVLVASLLVRKLGCGALVATDSGGVHAVRQRAQAAARARRSTAPWSEMTVERGTRVVGAASAGTGSSSARATATSLAASRPAGREDLT